MAELTPDIAAVVRAACEKNAEQAADAFSRTLETALTVIVGAESNYRLDQQPAGCEGPGLLVLLKFGAIGAIGILPESSGLLPAWYAETDATVHSRLATLAQELGMLLVPEAFMADEFKAARVENLAAALKQAGIASGAGLVPLTLTAGERRGTFSFVWPCTNPDAAFHATHTEPVAEAEGPTVSAEPTAQPKGASLAIKPGAALASLEDLEQLPPYTRSLLRIKVPVMVTLASKKQSIHQIVELGAGSIIKFEKSCEEMLELEVGGLPIALGEAVKVGDKFGLRINSMILPGERFNRLSPRRHGA